MTMKNLAIKDLAIKDLTMKNLSMKNLSIKNYAIKNLTKEQQTAQEFVNVKDIKDKFLYTLDGFLMMYIKINPISIELLSDREKKLLCRMLTAELSGEQKPFKFIAVSRPVDISPLIGEYTAIMANSQDEKQKELLKSEMMVMSNYALSGDVVERQFYFMIWEPYEEGVEGDIAKRAYEFAGKFENCNVSSEILKYQGIIRLCNLINNPASTNAEDVTLEASIPLIWGLDEADNDYNERDRK